MTTNTYIAGRGVLYRFDPRAKLLFVVFMCVLFFLPLSLTGLWGTVMLILAFGWYAVGMQHLGRTAKTILFMLCFMVLFSPLSSREGEVLLSIGSMVILTQGAVLQTARLMARFVGITYLCVLLFQTTRMSEVLLALRWYRLPYRAALLVTLTFRFIPYIAETFALIEDSHKLREPGLEEDAVRAKGRLRRLFPTLVSALVVALRSVPMLAMSLEHRGFGRGNARTAFHVLVPWTKRFTHFLFSIMIPAILWFIFRR